MLDFRIETHADLMKIVSVHARNNLLIESEVKLLESWCGVVLLHIAAVFCLSFSRSRPLASELRKSNI